ncbi:4-hydroxy-tetrahydrodipicolinate synthase [candidate division WOR-3 bacterium]|uniref:4-hydroxy-tetrahydrodipicolinate synthase n=1 Tax=candidate division WOR-3 bacterium TaxID=2052148 RepID=A0A938BUT8_UNCW3|nr:4-hydroxy-tetrahydrodipicolinate synthase [candidate division WOR-3 bacterium]
MSFSGCITALVTPFRGTRLDLAGLRENVRFQIKNRVRGLLVNGSTGEAPNLSSSEWERTLAAVVAEVHGRVKVVAGAGTNSTAKSVRQAKRAAALGADALLVVAPYYNKPTQEGLYRHYRAIADAVELPIIVYNIPPRSVVNILPATIERMARDCSNIAAVKEASGSLDQSSEIIQRCGNRVTLLSGDDSLTLPILAVGGKGVISVVSNIAPLDVSKIIDYYLAGKVELAAGMHRKLFPLIKAMFIETNPAPVKAAMQMLNMAAGEPRLPLVSPTENSLKAIRQSLVDYGLPAGA